MDNKKLNFESEPYVSLATFRRDGREVCTPVWLAGSDGRYYVFSEGNAGKVKRIRANGRARLAACNMRGKISGDWHDATASIVTDAAEVDAAYLVFRAKYGWQIGLTNFFSKLSGRYKKRAMLKIELSS